MTSRVPIRIRLSVSDSDDASGFSAPSEVFGIVGAVGGAHAALEITLVSRVTAPLRARDRPES